MHGSRNTGSESVFGSRMMIGKLVRANWDENPVILDPAGTVRLLSALDMFPDDPVARARDVASLAHARQVDHAGRPYLAHPRRVAGRLAADGQPDDVVAAGWLHDVVEDSSTSLSDLERIFTDRPKVTQIVDAITQREHESRDDYYARVREMPEALFVKWADLCDNLDPDRLAVLPPATRERLRAKYGHAIAVLSRP